MDAFGIHPYPDVAKPLSGRAPRSRIDLFDVPALARLVGVPVAVTEFGWSSLLAGADNQATWTAQAISVARCTPGLSQFVFWGYHDHPVPAGKTPTPGRRTAGSIPPVRRSPSTPPAPQRSRARPIAPRSARPQAPGRLARHERHPARRQLGSDLHRRTLSAVVRRRDCVDDAACTDYDGDALAYRVKTHSGARHGLSGRARPSRTRRTPDTPARTRSRCRQATARTR